MGWFRCVCFCRRILIILFLLYAESAIAQRFSYPKIKNTSKNLTDFVPKGWTILDSVKGKLNSDKFDDLAMVLQYADGVKITEIGGSDTDSIITQPRILIILFGGSKRGYKLVEQSNTFILNDNNPTIEDPFESIEIKDKVLYINFHIFHNMGSWYVINTSYKFRYQTDIFALIGADNSSIHRATHDFEEFSYNFLTKKWSLTKSNDSAGNKPTTEWHHLELNRLKTFKTFTQPYSWEVTTDNYL